MLTIWEDPINDLNAFRKLAQSSLQAQVPRHDFSTIDIVPLQQTWPKVIGTYVIDHGNQYVYP